MKSLRSLVSDEGSFTKETKTRTGTATSATTKLAKVSKCNNISFPVKVKLYKALIVSTLGCESWTLTTDTQCRIQSFLGTTSATVRKGRQRKSSMDHFKEWSGCSFPTLFRSGEDGEPWRSLTAQVSATTPLWSSRPQYVSE